MSLGYSDFLKASPTDKRGVYADRAQKMGTRSQYIEKDFWACFTLRLLFGTVAQTLGPHFSFKGGTSLSKVYGAIDRFSEDLDIVISWDALEGEQSDPGEKGISGKSEAGGSIPWTRPAASS